jgi:hypothetical protein
MPSGGKGRGQGRPRWFTDSDCLNIKSDYRVLTQLRELYGLPRPHRPIVVRELAIFHETSERMIKRVLDQKCTEIKTAYRIRPIK